MNEIKINFTNKVKQHWFGSKQITVKNEIISFEPYIKTGLNLGVIKHQPGGQKIDWYIVGTKKI